MKEKEMMDDIIMGRADDEARFQGRWEEWNSGAERGWPEEEEGHFTSLLK